MNWDLCVEAMGKLDIGTASGWLERLARFNDDHGPVSLRYCCVIREE